jgi:hypothetical protein
MLRSCALAVLAVACLALQPPLDAADPAISFNRDIRPILVENCFACHGADSGSREADLRLDRRDDAIAFGAIKPGDPDSSPILDRIYSDDPEEVMPPPKSKKKLTAEQKKLLSKWIAEGAAYEPHWSFIPPKKPEPPAVSNEAWVRNPIDRFILADLDAAKLKPAAEADRRTLGRRAALDATGLPPDAGLLEAFVADTRPDAYERYVDALLATPEWGEHRARYWLDYARYADTHGIHFDNYREMWSFRHWVIKAFNSNMAFDEFTRHQLAGDLVDLGPEASPDTVLDARVGSGFNRCNMTTNEGGIIDDEYIVLYARDRTETTATVWMGLTVGCAVCHDHKFDPVTMKDFYALSAFFNNTTQKAKDGNIKDTPPILHLPLPDDRPRLAELEAALPAAKRALANRRKDAKKDFEAFLTAATPETVLAANPSDVPLVSIPFAEGKGTVVHAMLAGKPVEVPLSEKATWQDGPVGTKAILLDGTAAELPGVGDFEHGQSFTVSFWLRPTPNDGPYAVVAKMADTAPYRGWDVWVQGRRVGMHLVDEWPKSAMKVVAKKQLPADKWTRVTITRDGKSRSADLKIYYDGVLQKHEVENGTFKKGSIKNEVPFTVGSRTGGAGAYGVGLADLTIHGRAFSAAEIGGMSELATLAKVVALPPAERVAAADKLFDWWLGTKDEGFITATKTLADIETEIAAINKRGTIAHVMAEMKGTPKAAILDRGEYDKPKEEVTANTPESLPPFPASLPRNRLGLAEWLLSDDHPLTARVTVNRFWQEVFGNGLVRTTGDFGITGDLPSNPELLDWLAVEFRETGWDVKRLFRLMLTSATYRQSAVTTPEKATKDRENRLLSRGPRFRMDAEMIRDQALCASGLLVKKIGGPSVKPYQPVGVWEAVAMPESNTKNYAADKGENLYRRSLYWFWKRSAPPASLEIFNAPSREVCTVKRERTNTPLQALVTLNDPQFIEAARALADLALEQPGDDMARIDFVARRLLARPLEPDEQEIVGGSLAALATHYAAHPGDASKLVTVGESKPRASDIPKLAAWTMLVNELLNLDEVLCK